jgi:hypothetical protein
MTERPKLRSFPRKRESSILINDLATPPGSPAFAETSRMKHLGRLACLHEPGRIAGHSVDFEIDVVALSKRAERGDLQSVRDDQH